MLERLRDRVLDAARELDRLREENRHLTERLAALETEMRERTTLLVPGDETPEALRERIEGFISALDAYLAEE